MIEEIKVLSKKTEDKIEIFHGALIQHGSLSERVYLMKLNQTDPDVIISKMDELARVKKYTKIFAKVPQSCIDAFLAFGFELEAQIPDFYNGKDAAAFLAYYYDTSRQVEDDREEIGKVIDLAESQKGSSGKSGSMPLNAVLRQCNSDDAVRMSEIYRAVFPTYPFPIDEPGYIVKTMDENIAYYGVEIDRELVSLSSAEMDVKSGNVEMTDFATLPAYRGNSFASLLLQQMEKEMTVRGIVTAYTIARAVSPGMNITFSRADYNYGGRLINNTNISGKIESMNVWYKKL